MGGGGEGETPTPFPKICHTYPTIMKLGTVIPYPKKIKKIHESADIGMTMKLHSSVAKW